MIIPVILAGGYGTRLWPLSREFYPKQFLSLHGEKTLLQETLERVRGIEGTQKPLILCNNEHRFLVAEQLREIHADGSILIEPAVRNTAPATAVAALEAMTQEGDPLLLVLPADHVIEDGPSFREAVRFGSFHAGEGKLITFGIVPDKPETGYGYIEKGKTLTEDPAGRHLCVVDRFVEKPDLATAREYILSGNFLWNSGMFMFRASQFLAELEKFAPAIRESCKQAHERRKRDLDFIRLDPDAFGGCPSDSIDYAVMEKTSVAAVIPLACGWSDIGSWSALYDIGKRDDDGNILRGNVVTKDVRNCYIEAKDRLVAAIGLENQVIVETKDAVLVADRDKVQDVKAIVNRLKDENRDECSVHRKVYRPWGSYEAVDIADRFQVKRIVVKPKALLSAQMHHHRAEHWIVVKGTARITIGDQTILLSENESTYIPIGARHRLENPGKIPLELIEVQSGSYLGEDDIVRFDDAYGREDNERG